MTGRAPLPVGRAADERRRHVEEIKRRVASGVYRVPASEVALAILEHARDRRDR